MNKIKILFNLGETFFAFQPIFPQIALSGLRVPMTDYQTEAPQILRDFLSYHETIKAHSRRTVDEYFLDLRNFFRYLKLCGILRWPTRIWMRSTLWMWIWTLSALLL